MRNPYVSMKYTITKQGVVVIEEFEKAKKLLQDKNRPSGQLVSTLASISKKNPCKEVLLSTRIGRVVHHLCRHEDPNVASAAKAVYCQWKHHILSTTCRPKLDVQCDAKTQICRETAMKWLRSALNDEELVAQIEQKVFYENKQILSNRYRRTVRRIVFAVKAEDLRTKVLSGDVTVTRLVSDYNKS